jgi:hypothetical protein
MLWCSESVQTVSPALCSTLSQRASRNGTRLWHTPLGNVSAKGGLYCIISTFTDYTIYYINSLYETGGRPIICKNTA